MEHTNNPELVLPIAAAAYALIFAAGYLGGRYAARRYARTHQNDIHADPANIPTWDDPDLDHTAILFNALHDYTRLRPRVEVAFHASVPDNQIFVWDEGDKRTVLVSARWTDIVTDAIATGTLQATLRT